MMYGPMGVQLGRALHDNVSQFLSLKNLLDHAKR
jgi:hypothetical protein